MKICGAEVKREVVREERDWGGERREIGVERVERLRWRAES